MNRLFKNMSAVLLVFFLCFSFARATNADVTPYAFGTYKGQMEVPVSVPAYKSPLGYTVEKWSFNMIVKYQVNYNINTGKISSVTLVGTEIGDGAFSPDERGRATSVNYESCRFSIVNNGYSIKCNYVATATLIYCEYPGLPITQETITESVSGEATISPPLA